MPPPPEPAATLTPQPSGPAPASAGRRAPQYSGGSFRAKLLTSMTLIIVSLCGLALYLANRSVTLETQHDLQRAFASELALLRTVRDIRHATLSEQCRALVHKPRIHAALRDHTPEQLYPNAKEELGAALPPGSPTDRSASHHSIRARFYRFLDLHGAVIPPPDASEVGALAPDEERRLSFDTLPHQQQNGYLVRSGREIVEIIITPIVSTTTGQPIAALLAGFPVAIDAAPTRGFERGIWLDGELHLPTVPESHRAAFNQEVSLAVSSGTQGIAAHVGGTQLMLFCERLNPRSLFAPAYDVGIYPLTELLTRQHNLRWNTAIAAVVLLGLGIGASFYLSARLAEPVHELAAVSAENLVLRQHAESALQIKTDELERSARFSADAAHQLKTPVAVLRAGMDELISSQELPNEVREELAILVHQTFRLSSIIEDLMLLSRLDSGRLELCLSPVNLTTLVEICVEDVELLHLENVPRFQLALPEELLISAERRYTMLILENLLDNARKYGTPGEPIRIAARQEPGAVTLLVANRGVPVPPGSWEHIFERFHRAAYAENISGHGLGLNLCQELARLHGGCVRLVRSDDHWTEFEAQFRPAQVTRQ
jgi:signal transduction histidine kinase